jgi:hypothetical protein
VLPLLLGTYMLYLRFLEPEQLRREAERQLAAVLGTPILVGAAEITGLSGISLLDVTIGVNAARSPDAPAPAPGELVEAGPLGQQLGHCRRIDITHDPMKLLGGSLAVRSLIAHEPRISVVRELPDHRTNLARLFFGRKETHGYAFDMPSIELRNARFSVSRELPDGSIEVIEDLTLTIRGGPTARDPLQYNVLWQGPQPSENGHTVVDLHTGEVRNVRGGLPWMSIEGVMLAVDARFDGAGSWCDLLGLDGTVRATDYHLGGGPDEVPNRSATIELSGAALSIPVSAEEHALWAGARYLTFGDVEGRIDVTPSGLNCAFQGDLHGARCDVSAVLTAAGPRIRSLEDVGLDARLTVRGFTWPSLDPDAPDYEHRFIRNWDRLENFFIDFQPGGTSDIELSVRREAGAEVPLTVRLARLDISAGDVCVSSFAYPVHQVTGVIEYTPEGTYLQNLTGVGTGGIVRLDGWFERPHFSEPSRLEITATDIPVDQALLLALDPKLREAVRSFHAAGVIDIAASLRREASGHVRREEPWSRSIAISFDDLAFAYEGFPYPVSSVSGRIDVEDGLIHVVNLQGRNGDTRVAIDGTATVHDDRMEALDLAVSAEGARMDDAALLRAMPEALQAYLSRISARGVFGAAATLGWNGAERRIEPRCHLFLEDVTTWDRRLPLPVEHIRGTVLLQRDRVELRGLSGRHGRGRLGLDGELTWATTWEGGDPTGLTLDLTTDGLELNAELIATLPEPHRSALSPWRITGGVRSRTSWTQGDAERQDQSGMRTRVELTAADIAHDLLPGGLRAVTGIIELADGALRSASIEGRYETAPFRASVSISADGTARQGTIRLTADGIVLDDALRDALPEAGKRVWDALGPVGSIDLDLDELTFEQSNPQAPTQWDVSGACRLHNVALAGFAGGLRQLSGVVRCQGRIGDASGGSTFTGRAELATARALGLLARDVTTSWEFVRSRSGEGCLAFSSLAGELYGGSLMGERVAVHFGEQPTTYTAQLAARAVDFASLYGAASPIRVVDDDDDPTEEQGWFEGRLYLTGVMGDEDTRAGEGAFKLIDARLYRLPVVLEILNYLNPTTPPQPGAFRYASAQFTVLGRQIHLSDVLLTGPALTLVGGGTVTLADQHLDLRLKPTGDSNKLRIPLLSDLIEGTARSLVGLRILGPLDKPVVRAESLPGVAGTLDDLFQRRDRSGPYPAPHGPR